MERRVLLAIFLAFIVLYTWQALFVKPVPKTEPKRQARRRLLRSARREHDSKPRTVQCFVGRRRDAASGKPNLNGSAGRQRDAERDVRVETRDIIAVFTNRGARLKSWRLKHFLDSSKQPQELIEQKLPTQPLPFTLRCRMTRSQQP
jgi:YidC/Oxa1 family membrane protein insertase